MSVSRMAQTDAEGGEYWLVTKAGEDPWPVVICDESMVRSYFKTKERPEGARRQDGTWGEEFKTHGKRFGERYFPALKLGIMKFCWAPWKFLKPIDIQMAVYATFQTTDRELSKAYLEVVEQYNRKDLTYWKDRLFAAKLDKEQEPEESRGEKRKATAITDSGYSSRTKEAWLNNAKDHDEDLFLANDEPAMKRVKNEFIGAMSEAENDALYEDPKPKSPSSARHAIGRTRFDSAKRSPARSMTPFRARSSSVVKDPTMATLYVGNPHHLFRVPLLSIKASPFLLNHLSYSVADGSYIMIPALSKMSPSDFDAVSEFFHRGEYRPNILDADTPFVRLEETSARSEDDNEYEIHRCGVIYCMAWKLELRALQDLAVRKLKVLEPFFSESKSELLGVVELVYPNGGAERDKDLDEWMAGRLAEWFRDLMRGSTLKFLEVLDKHERLAKRVYGILASSVAVKDEAEEDDRDIKGEEGAKGEVKGLDDFLDQSVEI